MFSKLIFAALSLFAASHPVLAQLEPASGAWTSHTNTIVSIDPRAHYTFLRLGTPTNLGCTRDDYIVVPKVLPNHNTIVQAATLAHMQGKPVLFVYATSGSSSTWTSACITEYGLSFRSLFGLNVDLR